MSAPRSSCARPQTATRFSWSVVSTRSMRHSTTSSTTISSAILRQSRASSAHHLSWWSIHRDRKSTRLNSSHLGISYAVFCLKKKKNKINSDIEKDSAPPALPRPRSPHCDTVTTPDPTPPITDYHASSQDHQERSIDPHVWSIAASPYCTCAVMHSSCAVCRRDTSCLRRAVLLYRLWRGTLFPCFGLARSHRLLPCFLFFFFNDTATTEIYTLSLHDALPI